MRLGSELARKIISEVETLTTESIIVVNKEGMIIASTDVKRVGGLHEGAMQVMRMGKKLYITHDMAVTMGGVKPGINLPIHFGRNIIGVIGITGIPTDVEPFADLIRRMTELMIREAYYSEKKEWETRGIESFFYEWIYTKTQDDQLQQRGEILGVSFDIPYQCILIQLDPQTISEDLIHVQNDMYDWFDHEFSNNQNDFLIRWGNGRFLLVKNAEHLVSTEKLTHQLKSWQKYFQEKHQIYLACGIGKTIEKKHISQSYHEAKKALNIAVKNFSIIPYESLLLEMILGEISTATKDEYVNKVMSSIKREGELMKTLKLYFKNNMSLKKTAHDLHIHINTLHYRLNQIKKMTTIDPKSAEGIILFYLAFELDDNHD